MSFYYIKDNWHNCVLVRKRSNRLPHQSSKKEKKENQYCVLGKLYYQQQLDDEKINKTNQISGATTGSKGGKEGTL